jgi:hypothetical protein
MPIFRYRLSGDRLEVVYFHQDTYRGREPEVFIARVPVDAAERAQFDLDLHEYRNGGLEAAGLRRLADRLSRWLLRGELGVWAQAIPGAAGVPLPRLIFDVEDSARGDLEPIPLELVCDRDGNPLADGNVSLVRFVNLQRRPPSGTPPPPRKPFRLLLVRANPTDRPPVPPVLGLAQQVRSLDPSDGLLLDVLTTEEPTGQAPDVKGPPTWEVFLEQLRRTPYHLLVFLGHGDVQTRQTQGRLPGGQLVFEREGRNQKRYSRTVSGRTLSQALSASPIPAVVLVGCLTGADLPPGGRAALPDWVRGNLGVAQQLVQDPSGVTCAVGMQQRLRSEDALTFLDVFLQSLLRESPGHFEAGVQAGRRALRDHSDGPAAWSAPVVFSYTLAEPMFEFLVPAPLRAPQLPADVEKAIREAVGRMKIRDVLDALAQLNVAVGAGVGSELTPEQYAALFRWAAEAPDRPAQLLDGLNKHAASLIPIRLYLELVPKIVEGLFPHGFVSPTAVDLEAPPDAAPLDAVACVREAVSAQKPAFLLVLGDYGAGKSSLCFGVGTELAREALPDFPNRPMPLYLNLGYSRAKAADNLLDAMADLLQEDYKITVTRRDLEQVIQKHRTVMFLDGLDEMVSRVHVEELPRVLDKIRALTRVSRRMDVVLTCRETFFQSRIEIRLIEATRRVRLLPFNDDQIRRYLDGWGPVVRADAEGALAAEPELRSLISTPVHLFLFAEYLDRSRKEARPVGRAGLLELYDSFVEASLQRSLDQELPDWPVAERLELLRELSYRWLREGTVDWDFRQFEDFVRSSLNETERELPAKDRLQLIRKRAKFVTTCSFMRRIAASDRFRFTHKSFQEYLAADGLVHHFFAGRPERWNTALYAEIFEFAARMMRRANLTADQAGTFLARGIPMAQMNLNAVIHRLGLPWVDDYIIEQIVNNPHPSARASAASGFGALPASPKTIDCALTAIAREPNSVLREMARKVLHWFAREAAGEVASYRADEVARRLAEPVCLVPADAEKILDGGEKGDDSTRNLCRRALHSLDPARWVTIIGAMYLLGATGDGPSRDKIEAVGRSSQVPEVRLAYEEVRALATFTPPLPELPLA